ncbi:MAG: patatin-like phospholipase family protein [Solirubrobacteraceae bacterium]
MLALAVEGGGMRGAVSSGMCVVLEAAGLLPAFDRIYGTSAGALNGAATAAGQAAMSSTHYQDAALGRVIYPLRALRRRPIIDFDLMFGEVIARRKPLSWEAFSAGPDFSALATSLETGSLAVLHSFTDLDELMLAVRASASVPFMCGHPPAFRGERLADGGLIEPIPYETALREGATDVLVLRTRPAGDRKRAPGEVAERLVMRTAEPVRTLLREQAGRYNRQAGELQAGNPHISQVAVPEGTRLIRRFERDSGRVVEALRLGAAAMAAAVLSDPIELCWQPVAHRAPTVGPGEAESFCAAPRRRAPPRGRCRRPRAMTSGSRRSCSQVIRSG